MEKVKPEESISQLQAPDDVLGQVLMHLQRLKMEIQTAKNLVNGKPIDADRKLQGVLTRCDNLLNDLNVVRTNELATKSNEEVSS